MTTLFWADFLSMVDLGNMQDPEQVGVEGNVVCQKLF
jgi:hypothetical protein